MPTYLDEADSKKCLKNFFKKLFRIHWTAGILRLAQKGKHSNPQIRLELNY